MYMSVERERETHDNSTCYLLLPTYYLLPTTYYLLLTTCYLLPILAARSWARGPEVVLDHRPGLHEDHFFIKKKKKKKNLFIFLKNTKILRCIYIYIYIYILTIHKHTVLYVYPKP